MRGITSEREATRQCERGNTIERMVETSTSDRGDNLSERDDK